MTKHKMYPVEEAIKAQSRLRDEAGLNKEEFPIQAFVGMISDEIEVLRRLGQNDREIASMIEQSSSIRISPEEIAAYYATPEQRRPHGEPHCESFVSANDVS